MNYADKRRRVEALKDAIKAGRDDLHPAEHAEACREIQIFAEKEAEHQESVNDEQGVPERPKDLSKRCEVD